MKKSKLIVNLNCKMLHMDKKHYLLHVETNIVGTLYFNQVSSLSKHETDAVGFDDETKEYLESHTDQKTFISFIKRLINDGEIETDADVETLTVKLVAPRS